MNIKSHNSFIDNFSTFQIGIGILLFSLLYGFLINPSPQENVTLAYILYQKFDIDYFHHWSSAVSGDPTLQISLPHSLFKLGINKIIIHQIWQSLNVFISMISLFYLSKLITKSNYYSILIILILLNHKFINTNLYGIYYPSHFYYLGQVGMYLTLLSYALFINKNTSSSFVILAINIFFHAAWGIFNIFLLILTKIFFFKKYKINLTKLFIIIIIFISLIFVFSIGSKKEGIFDNFSKNISEFTIKFNNQENNKNTRNYEKDFALTDQDKKIREGHRIHLDNYKDYKELSFFIIKLVFYEILLLILFVTFRKKSSNFKKYLIPILFSTFLIYIFLFSTDIIFSKAFYYSEFLATKLDRVSANRFLNINNVSFIVLSLSFFFKVCSEFKDNRFISLYYKLSLSFLSLGLIIFSERDLSNLGFYGSYIKYYSIIIWFICVSSIILYFYSTHKNLIKTSYIEHFSFKMNFSFFEFLLILSILFFLIFDLHKTNYQKNSSNFELLRNINTKKVVLFGGNIYGKLDTLYYSEITWIIPDATVKVKNLNNKSDIDIFCIKEAKNIDFLRQNDFHDFINYVCFPGKETHEWEQIKLNYDIEYIIVPNNSILKLKKVAENKHFNIYQI